MIVKGFNTDRIFFFCLLGSFLGHVLLLPVTNFIVPMTDRIKVKPIEVIYRSPVKDNKANSVAQIQSVGDRKETRKASTVATARNLTEKQLLGTTLFRDTGRAVTKIDISDKQTIKMANLVEKRSITVPVWSSQKITNPQYLSYNDRIRDKIRNRAYFYIDDPKFEAGDVYMTFVVTSDGVLKDLQVINERSRANEYLRHVGLRSIKESSPFPPFPVELKYPELSFNVVISFEVSK